MSFKQLEFADVTYSYHCCLFRTAFKDGLIGQQIPNTADPVLVPTCANTTFPTPTTKQITSGRFPNIKPSTNSTNAKLPNNTCVPHDARTIAPSKSKLVKCTPLPDVFNPCDNLLGLHVLRAFSWIVMIFAILGNSVKLLVLSFNKRPLTIYKTLMFNLAFANLCMGVYLASLVIIDIHSYGEYQNYARSWQFGGGCKAVGFFSIFSTELVVYTLTVITIERYFMIVHPLQYEKHLSLRQIVILLAVGWIFSVVMATLPLLGISSYEKVAICLPFEVEGGLSRAYVTFLLVTNGLAFFTVLFCYAWMYLSLGTSSSSDTRIESRVAKRMAILIFTNFACWFPIALLGLISIYGQPVVDVNTSKFFLVFIYPINSFTNPYLYAINTKSFQLDVLNILAKNKLCRDKLEATGRRLQSEPDTVPNSTRCTSADSKLSLNSARSTPRSSSSLSPRTKNKFLHRNNSKCSCTILCIHSGTYEPTRVTHPTPSSPSEGSPNGSLSSDVIGQAEFRNAWRRSSMKKIIFNGEVMSGNPDKSKKGKAGCSERDDLSRPNEDCARNEYEMSALVESPLRAGDSAERLMPPNEQDSEREDGRGRYTSIPVVLVTSC